MKLTDDFAENVTLADSKAGRKYTDGQGLYLHVNKSGKYWRMSYRFGGKPKTLALGVYPAVLIDEARQRCRTAREMVRSGINPTEERRANRQFQRAADIGQRPRHPGAVLREQVLSKIADAQSLPAGVLILPIDGIEQLMDEQSPMTCEIALQLENLLSIKAEKWMALQLAVDLWDAREKLQRMRAFGKSLQLDGQSSEPTGG